MKKYILFKIALTFVLNITAQNQENISLNPGYSHQSFYSMLNGEIINIENDNWDLAFGTDIYSANIRINGGKGVELYTYSLGDTSAWSSINSSTVNILTNPMNNSDTSWGYGAFLMNQASGMFDYGWGVYNIQTHHIVGDSIFLIRTINGNWKKLWIESKASGEYFFTYSNLDGSNEVNESIQASNYSDKRFIYYSLENSIIIDREPALSDWDITFTKYITPVQGIPYSVTGALANVGIKVAQADNIQNPLSYDNYISHNFETEINSMGYDWKQFQGSYTIVADRAYFVKDYLDNVWRVVFTGFDGMSTGNIEFNSTLLSTSSTNDIYSNNSFNIYPNPCSYNNNINIVYDINQKSSITIYDIYGKKVYSNDLIENGFNTHIISSNLLKKGTYLVTISNITGNIFTKKLIVY
tara:strand:+ start:19792 stop:21027 length:1236 start_codon:yes stop_codon:yes gene_type:complete